MDIQDHINLYAVGTKVWIPCDSEVWQTAEIIDAYDGNKITVRKIKSRNELVIKITSDEELPPLQNPDILLGENDLTSLSYLHEPAILYNLYCRFVQSHAIYTYCGIVLVAINPYKELDIYGIDTMMAYRGQTMGSLDPHVFAVAEQAFNKMEIENNNQSIIVSGESGAGKTVSAKYAMRYFATISGSETETQVEKKVLASSPIMEAIGNAKTTRNDNSSRFGKYIELHFNERYHITGASMRTYLLEKSRVVHQAVNERNYHIFYQLCSSREAFPHLKLGDSEEYFYLSSQPSSDHDQQHFMETVNALNILGFSLTDQDMIWKLLASILHIGNIEISIVNLKSAGDSDSCHISLQDPSLEIVSTLLDINKAEFHKWLCYRRIVSMKETYEKPMTVDEASGARDALAKHMYASLFQWLISIMNRTMCESSQSINYPIIGVLDIYGFEMFELNSFEQFCINYANEKLQQQFNLHVFKLEQEEYGKEGIEWKFIDFYDNQPCIDLIESKLGILDLLDEECRMPQGSDASWTQKLYTKCTKWDRFSKPKFAASAFTIKHFAGDVEYYTDGFLDKNKDTVIEDQVNVLRNGKNSVLRTIFMIDNLLERKLSVSDRKKSSTPKSATIGGTPKSRMLTPMRPICATIGSPSQSKQNKKTVGSQFRDSLNALMTTLNDTTPHYIRCIKPNDDKLPFVFDHQRAVDQLRACGVLETIRISAAGFPSRWTYVDFFLRYRVLLKSKKINRDDPKLTCQRIIEEHIQTEDNYKYGNTKIFFRAGQVAYLERKRADRRKDCSICIQKTWRRYICQKKYMQIRCSVLLIQRYGRGYLDRRLATHLRRTKAATKIQKVIRSWLCRRKYLRIQAATLVLQQYYRGYVARKLTHELRRNNAAVRIQSIVRMWLCYRHYHTTLAKIIQVQCCIRRWFARRCLKALKKEARSVAHVTKLNKGLENKIYTMQQKITELNNQLSSTKSLEIELHENRQKLAEQKQVISELNISKKQAQKVETQLNALQIQYEAEKEITAQMIQSYNEKCTNAEQKLLDAQKVIENLEFTLTLIKQENEKNLKDIQENWSSKYDSAILKAREEIELEKSVYQKLLLEKHSVEEKLEMLERQTNSMTGNGLRRNASDLSLVSYKENGYETNNDTQKNNVNTEELKKLQKTLKAVLMERDMLLKRIENDKLIQNNSSDNDVSWLKEQNYLLQQNLNSLRETTELSGNNNFIVVDDLTRKLETMQNELLKRKSECVKLHERIDGMAESLRKIVDYETTTSSLTEDRELNQAMDAQKAINRHLLEEFQTEKEKWKEEKEKMSNQLIKLLEENENQQELLGIEFDKNPQCDAILQSDMNKLNYEHLQLQKKYDELLRKYVALRNDILLNGKENSTINFDVTTDNENFANSTTISVDDGTVVAKKKNRSEFMGMFQCSIEDDLIVARNLIIELKPETALKLLPGLPAYILFMCIRYHDFNKEERRIALFLTNVVKNLQKVLKKRRNQDSLILWLSNTMKLVHILKQYSGEPAFSSDNTTKQNSQVLQNFDLADYRQVFCDHVVILYQELVQKMQDSIRVLIVPAILEHDSLGIDIGRNIRRSLGSLKHNQSPTSPTTSTLEMELNTMYNQLVAHDVDQEVVIQIFKQLYYYICANALNNLLLRKDLSYWSKGMQIRFNLSHLEQWIRDKIPFPQDVVNTLLPIIQASQLLQARKTNDDVNAICEMCDKMNANQIIKLLTSFKPTDDCEERISMDFIRKVKDKLEERPECQDKEKLLMDTKYVYPITFQFHPSNIRLDDIEIPEVLNLSMLKKI